MDMDVRLFFDPRVKSFVDNFSYCFDVKITFYSVKMEEWLVGYHSDASDYCLMIQQELRLRPRCMHLDWLMCRRCGQSGRSLCYPCHGGMTEIIVPIRLEGKVVAYAMMGQFRRNALPPKDVVDAWVSGGRDPKVLEKAYTDRPLFSSEKVRRITSLFSQNLELLASTQSLRVRQSDIIEQVFAYVEKHIGRAISLEEVSSVVGKSPSTITHAMKKRLGISFKSAVIGQKLQKFETLVKHDPGMTISQAAAMVGYDDALYFSRLYRRSRQSSPSEFRDLVRKSSALRGR